VLADESLADLIKRTPSVLSARERAHYSIPDRGVKVCGNSRVLARSPLAPLTPDILLFVIGAEYAFVVDKKPIGCKE
jgi:hypothetical protein